MAKSRPISIRQLYEEPLPCAGLPEADAVEISAVAPGPFVEAGQSDDGEPSQSASLPSGEILARLETQLNLALSRIEGVEQHLTAHQDQVFQQLFSQDDRLNAMAVRLEAFSQESAMGLSTQKSILQAKSRHVHTHEQQLQAHHEVLQKLEHEVLERVDALESMVQSQGRRLQEEEQRLEQVEAGALFVDRRHQEYDTWFNQWGKRVCEIERRMISLLQALQGLEQTLSKGETREKGIEQELFSLMHKHVGHQNTLEQLKSQIVQACHTDQNLLERIGELERKLQGFKDLGLYGDLPLAVRLQDMEGRFSSLEDQVQDHAWRMGQALGPPLRHHLPWLAAALGVYLLATWLFATYL
jgi:chromosome segregation ATPase